MANVSPVLHLKGFIASLKSVKQCEINRISCLLLCFPQNLIPVGAVKNL